MPLRVRLLMFTCPLCHEELPEQHRGTGEACFECEALDEDRGRSYKSRRPLSDAAKESGRQARPR